MQSGVRHVELDLPEVEAPCHPPRARAILHAVEVSKLGATLSRFSH